MKKKLLITALLTSISSLFGAASAKRLLVQNADFKDWIVRLSYGPTLDRMTYVWDAGNPKYIVEPAGKPKMTFIPKGEKAYFNINGEGLINIRVFPANETNFSGAGVTSFSLTGDLAKKTERIDIRSTAYDKSKQINPTTFYESYWHALGANSTEEPKLWFYENTHSHY